MRLATQDKPFFPDQFAEKLQFVKSMGFAAFEVDGKVLIERFAEIKQAIRETGVPVCTACGGYRGWIGDFDREKRRQAIADISEILKHVAEIAGQGIIVPAAWGMFSRRLPPLVPPRSEEEDRRILLDSLAQLNRTAQETGTYLYLEPLNRYEDHMLNKLSDAVSLIEEGNFSNVKVTADFFHMNIEEASVEASLRAAQQYIGHIHLADSHRYQPGDGHLDFVSGFKVLHEIGYAGYMAFECRVLGEPAEEAYRKSVKYIQSCLRQAGEEERE
ncbi:sugar phosphate isomerase/epimerase family protein [Lihuaxuella thermophila]|uniref:Sugar phosphate isomerase/epimerase n=1 Tax=Lihuaxuella thermophila TaxID=1173111 RepID=A0A1H8AKA6_9BACL|nr:sugar phosphate isomerase/epimerase family protein [Lihuaxuella thermophila]SEM70424.1 Sugar phosphate isomerase/epimerase [Lihuaxuella thermophila]